jgi:hypothetical protein
MKKLDITLSSAVLALVVGVGAAQAGVGDKPIHSALAKMSPATIAERIEVRDDPLEDHVLFSTKPVFRKGGFTGGVAVHDGFIKASKPRDGAAAGVSWRVSYDLTYFGARRDVTQVNIRSADGLLKIAPAAVRRWSEECGADATATCGQHMTVEFEAPEKVIRDIAAAYKPGDRTPWRVRFKDDHGEGLTIGIAPAEVAALVNAVDSWKR